MRYHLDKHIMRNWGEAVFLYLCILLFLSECMSRLSYTESIYERRGSFTMNQAYYYGNKYLAIQEVGEGSDTGGRYVMM